MRRQSQESMNEQPLGELLSKKKIAISLFLTVTIVGGDYVAVRVVSHRRIVRAYERGYPQIKVGDSKDIVIKLMGKPSRITDCVYPWFSDEKTEAEYRSNSKELYHYEEIFPVDYTISFDKEERVINKTTAVSP